MNRGIRNTQITITANLIIAVLLIALLFGGFKAIGELFYYWPLNIGVAITALYFSGYIFGEKLDKSININKRNPLIYGSISLFIILLIGIISGATVGFFQEGIDQVARNGLADALFDYYVKPLYWIVLFGFIPTLLAGGFLGYSIKKDV